MNKSDLLIIYKYETKMNLLSSEMRELSATQKKLTADITKLKEKLSRTEKDIFVWINTFTKPLRDGERLKQQ